MKEVRFFVYVLLCSLFLVQINIANNTQHATTSVTLTVAAGSLIVDHGTSPVKEDEAKLIENGQPNHGTSPIKDHGTTPIIGLPEFLNPDSLKRDRSFQSLQSLQRSGSHTFSAEDLAMLVRDHSPRKSALLPLPVNTLHGTSPVN